MTRRHTALNHCNGDNLNTVLILGAGMAGLGAARVLRAARVPYRIVEREAVPGGLAITDRIGAFLFDRAGHFIHRDGHLFDEVIVESAVQFEQIDRRAAVLIGKRAIPYPAQFNLWAADEELAHAVERELDALPASVHHCGDFATLVEQCWGGSLSEALFKPYAEKVWACRADQLPADWCGRFIPRRDLSLIRRGLRRPVTGYGYNASFLYPRSGRMGEFAQALAAPHAKAMELSTEVVAVDLGGRSARCAGGRTIRFAAVINTLPLNRFMEMCGCAFDRTWFRQANLINLRVGFRGSVRAQEHWYYIPDRAAQFFRVGFPGTVNARTCPTGYRSLSIEFGIGTAVRPPQEPALLAQHAVDYLSARGIIECQHLEVVDAHLIAPAYVADRVSSTPQLQATVSELQREGVVMSAGRFGTWDYLSIEEAFVSGMRAAERIVGGAAPAHQVHRARRSPGV